eukprot:TRINITY_DN24599_c0_g1_i1.p1 TRINITY_DN24599_c0_g1~~TRINITY_DN24599_c0_g1_i1.p1  ORF type:complete len:344 (-),score=60.70 TRINITY_DN24599_c0_g1_i1:328-1359(-)
MNVTMVSLRLLVMVLVALGRAGSSNPHPDPDPSCSTGVIAPDTRFCCAHECGECGGSSCQNRPGGAARCCTREISKADRPCSTHAPPCVMPQGVREKRGFVADGVTSCDTPILLNTSGWFYDYNLPNPFRATKGIKGDCARMNASGHVDLRFVPMNWCLSSVNQTVPDYVNTSFFMGFNEPNNRHNCNTDASTVAKAWGIVMQRWPNSQLVSPATAGNGTQWYDEFFAACKKLYGKSGCRIAYLATHDYSCTATSTLKYLEGLYKRYGKKVWLTEFSCGDGADARPTADHLQYMKEVLPLLDASPFVFRYSWMSLHSPRRGLVTTDALGNPVLTALGELYQRL